MANSSRTQRRELFERAIDLPSDARSELLAEVAADDPELARKVEELVEGAHAADRLVAKLVVRELEEAPAVFPYQAAPGHIGPYRIVRLLARGGMGAVYLGERVDEAYSKKVAVKLVEPMPFAGLSADELLARFRLERQILADLEHPHIARLLDGGTTPDGRPYLVMEYVEGEPIDRHCDRRHLSLRRRLELFLKVCEAVGFAHRHLVIHRDVKPSNILVTEDGEPKLLDFGIARLLETRANARLTRTVMGFLTPEFASPEQFLGGQITTATDVYSLGALLYVLVTGRAAHRFRQAGVEDALRIIRDQIPDRPSQALMRADVEPSPHALALSRGTTPERLARTLAVDLDHVILKALRKDFTDRYATVDQLAEDLRRYLAGQPIEARRGTLRYRARKFARRNRARLAAGCALLLVATAFWADRSLQSTRAAQAQAQAELLTDLSELLVEVFEVAEPGRAIASIRAPEILEEADRKLRPRLRGSPEAEASLVNLIGAVYQRLGYFEEAERSLGESLELRQTIFGTDHPDVASTLYRLGELHRLSARLEESAHSHRQALDIRRQKLGENHTLVAESIEALGNLRFGHHEMHFRDAKPLTDQALAILREKLAEESGPEPPVPASFTSRIFTVGYILADGASSETETFIAKTWRSSVASRFPHARFARLGSLNPRTLAAVDVLVLSSVTGSFEESRPLSRAEQAVLVSYVESGGCAILVTDNKDFDAANVGLLEPFGIRSEGHWPAIAVAAILGGSRHPVVDGPFGSIRRFPQPYTGGYTFLGPHARPVAANPVGVATAVIDPGALAPGSGPVVAFSDATLPERLLLNAVAWCVSGG